MPPLQAEGDPNQQKTQQLCAKIIASCTQRLKAAGAAKKAEKAAALAAPVPVTARLSMLVMALAYIVYAYRIEAVRVLLAVLLVLLLLLAARLVAALRLSVCRPAASVPAFALQSAQPSNSRLLPGWRQLSLFTCDVCDECRYGRGWGLHLPRTRRPWIKSTCLLHRPSSSTPSL
jgi:hypothetical protein